MVAAPISRQVHQIFSLAKVPFGQECPPGVEGLDAAVAIFADVEMTLAVSGDAAGIIESARADSLGSILEHHPGKSWTCRGLA